MHQRLTIALTSGGVPCRKIIRKLYNDKQMFRQPNGGYLDGWVLIARRPCTVNGTLPQGRNPHQRLNTNVVTLENKNVCCFKERHKKQKTNWRKSSGVIEINEVQVIVSLFCHHCRTTFTNCLMNHCNSKVQNAMRQDHKKKTTSLVNSKCAMNNVDHWGNESRVPKVQNEQNCQCGRTQKHHQAPKAQKPMEIFNHPRDACL